MEPLREELAAFRKALGLGDPIPIQYIKWLGLVVRGQFGTSAYTRNPAVVEISKALPDYVWLTNMEEARGNVKLQGQSNSLAAVADFISALQRSGWFPTVDLVSSQEQASVVNFVVSGTFKDPEVAAKEKAAADAKAAAAKVWPAR